MEEGRKEVKWREGKGGSDGREEGGEYVHIKEKKSVKGTIPLSNEIDKL